MAWVVIRTNAKSPEMAFQGEELSRWDDEKLAKHAAMEFNSDRPSPKIYAMVVPAARWDCRESLIDQVRRVRSKRQEGGGSLLDSEAMVDHLRDGWATV